MYFREQSILLRNYPGAGGRQNICVRPNRAGAADVDSTVSQFPALGADPLCSTRRSSYADRWWQFRRKLVRSHSRHHLLDCRYREHPRCPIRGNTVRASRYLSALGALEALG